MCRIYSLSRARHPLQSFGQLPPSRGKRVDFRVLLFCLILSLFFFLTPVARAELIDSRWQHFRDYERLVTCGVIDTPFFADRYWTKNKIAQALTKIKNNPQENECNFLDAEEILSRLDDFVKNENALHGSKIKAVPLGEVEAQFRFNNTGNSTYLDNNRGLMNATINTFGENKFGQVLGTGNQFQISSTHRLVWGDQELYLSPRAGVLFSSELDDYQKNVLTVDEAYALFNFGRFYLAMGRSPLIWGQSDYGGLIFSQNARALDHIRVGTNDGFYLPWVFKHIGKINAAMYFGNLGPEQFHAWGYFTGLSIVVKPTRRLELAMLHNVQFGGSGAPSMGLGDLAQEFFGFIPWVSQSAVQNSNKMTSLSARFLWPEFMGANLYGEYFMDDSNMGSLAAFKRHFYHNSSYKLGLLFTCFAESCDDAVNLEFRMHKPISYRHSTFQNGWTENQNIIGDPIGPDGYGFDAHWERRWSERLRTNLNYHYRSRSADVYTLAGLTVTKTTDNAEETRAGLVFGPEMDFGMFTVSSELGFEHIHNYQFSAGDNRVSGLVSGLVTYRY